MPAKSIVLLLSTVSALTCAAEDVLSRQADAGLAAKSAHYVTNVAQFSALSGADFLDGCDFHLTGVVTLVDTNRNLLVLQDTTGAVALNFPIEDQKLAVGQLVTLDGSNCSPYFRGFPNYPQRPTGWDIRSSFETPVNWGEYNLTRMRGYLHPPITGDYRFWIASDNSSELWLSTDAEPAKARRIASVARFNWVAPHEWSRFPSQRSELIPLKAGETYYIEALQEQTTVGENLSVAWQKPLPGGTTISVIDGRCLTPWSEHRSPVTTSTNGILREYWTNFTAGLLEGMGGARAFESALTVREVSAHMDGRGKLPDPDRIALNKPLPVAKNYRWVQAEGVISFKAGDANGVVLELSDGQALVQVRAGNWSREMWQPLSNAAVRVEGVCEGVYDQKETMMPGRIWASAENSVTFIEPTTTNEFTSARNEPAPPTTTGAFQRQGWYGIRCVVTFNDRIMGTNYIFAQGNSTAVRIALDESALESHLKVGGWVDLGGAAALGKYLPTITPLAVTELGWCSMPLPITQFFGVPPSADLEGKWSEIEGVVHSVSTNGTISLATKDGPACLWLGQTPLTSLTHYVDSKLRARGVLTLQMLDKPMLLIPSRDFLDVEEQAPNDPFAVSTRLIADVSSGGTELSWSHRIHVAGDVTYRDAQSFFVQDTSGAIRVETAGQPMVEVGDNVEVLAFPALRGSVRVLTDPLVGPARSVEPVKSANLDLGEALSSKQNGTLIQVSATLLGRKTNGMNQVLELQEQRRVFTATLAPGQGSLPDLMPGSRLRLVGVCEDEAAAMSLAGEIPPRPQLLSSLNILLRGPGDVNVIGGPPWWTWKRTATLVGTLLTTLLVTLLWVYLLGRRLERQQAAQLAFSRRVLARLEDERRRIAVNLHDSLGQTLLVIKNHAILATQLSPEEQGFRHRLDEISGATSQAIDEVRRITHGLRPYQLDRLGLTQAIRASISRASENSSILFASRVEEIDGLFDGDAEIHLYRIVQEAVTNVVKHSTATEATVVIKKRATVISFSIRDNGRGFDPAKPHPQTHDLGYGLDGIAERVRILKGTVVIDSGSGGGTSISIEVPFSVSNT